MQTLGCKRSCLVVLLILGLRDFTFVSGLVFLHDVRSECSARMILHVSHLSPLAACHPPASHYALKYSSRMILHVSLTCLRLSPTCLDSGCSARMILHASPTCLRLSPTCPPVRSGCSAGMILHFQNLSPRQFFLLVSEMDFSPKRFACERFLLLCKGCMLERHVGLCLDTLDALDPHGLLLSPTCLPAASHWILVSHFSPLDSFPMISHLSPTTLSILCPHDSRLVSHLSPSTHWVIRMLWSARFHTFPPLVSPTCILCLRDFWLVYDLSPTCLRLVST